MPPLYQQQPPVQQAQPFQQQAQPYQQPVYQNLTPVFQPQYNTPAQLRNAQPPFSQPMNTH